MTVLMKPKEYAQHSGLSLWRVRQMVRSKELATTLVGARDLILVEQSDKILGYKKADEKPVYAPAKVPVSDWFSRRRNELLAKCQRG